jgi:hypothetical protein
MDDPLSHGYAFDPGSIWRYPDDALDWQARDALLDSIIIPLQDLELNDKEYHDLENFSLPDLGAVDDPAESTLEDVQPLDSEALQPPSSERSTSDPNADIWTFEETLAKPLNEHKVHTWESFERKPAPFAERSAYISEAGQNASHIALSKLERSSPAEGALPQDVMLRALTSLALGRSSIFFTWDESKAEFAPTLPSTPFLGLSRFCSSSIVEYFCKLGTTFRSLDAFSSPRHADATSCTALVAFKTCVRTILDDVAGHFSSSTPTCRSILQLQDSVSRSSDLLEVLFELKSAVQSHKQDERLISDLSTCVQRIISAQSTFSEVLQLILSRASEPWLERLRVDLGLDDHYGRVPATSSAEQPDNLDLSVDTGPAFTESLPAFVSEEDAALIRTTRTSVKALREHLPDHRLPNSTFTTEPAFPANGRSNLDSSGTLENLAWADEEKQHDFLESLDRQIAQPLCTGMHNADALQSAVESSLHAEERSNSTKLNSMKLDFNPLEQLRPTIISHQAEMNRSLLRHVFSNLKLRQHLDLQRQYHLFGNGDFVARLSKALFSDDTQSAERKRGNIPTSGTMGLRLGAREHQHWPPASSELRLTLMGVLTETYASNINTQPSRPVSNLPGDLSFSIRELPDAEIEKVMDPESIYALDFLRLQYTAPPCLDIVLHPAAMQHYDSIFRLLLRLLRVLHVTTSMRHNLLSRDSEIPPSSAMLQFANTAHTVITVLMSHVMDVGIETPWRNLMAEIGHAESSLGAESRDISRQQSRKVLGLEELRNLHSQCLERMRSRLFLRRRQEKVAVAAERVLAGVLQVASTIDQDSGSGSHIDTRTFDDALSELAEVLQAIVDNPKKRLAANAGDETDDEATRILLLRLRTSHGLDHATCI